MVQARQQSEDARRIQRYLMWVAPATLVFSGVVASAAYRYPVTLAIVLAVLVFVIGIMQSIAYRLASLDRVQPAVWTQVASLWLISAALASGGLPLYSISVGLAILPVIIAVPYVGSRSLMGMAAISVVVSVVGGTFVVIGAPLPLDGVSEAAVTAIVGGGVIATMGACTLSLWYTRRTLDVTSTSIARVHRALQASEEELERKVARRSEELESSQRRTRRARDEALAANRHKSAFLANMSHELRTPLNAIIGFSEVLGERVFGDLLEKQTEYVGDIHESGRHLLALINDILDYSKIEAGRMELKRGPCDLTTLASDATTALADYARGCGVELQRKLCATAEIDADPRRVRQVIDNLLSNAIKFTPRGGAVTVSVALDDAGKGFLLRVSDTGIGIAPEDQEMIFDAFRQVASGPSHYAQAHEGTGVGLALTRKLVELHGGRVWVVSEPSAGSKFYARFPSGVAGLSAGAST